MDEFPDGIPWDSTRGVVDEALMIFDDSRVGSPPVVLALCASFSSSPPFPLERLLPFVLEWISREFLGILPILHGLSTGYRG